MESKMESTRILSPQVIGTVVEGGKDVALVVLHPDGSRREVSVPSGAVAYEVKGLTIFFHVV